MKITIREVAREANVSVATVSRVLNESGPVRADTRRRVEEVARQLGYSPNRAAQTLITKKTSALGVVLPSLYGEFFSEVIRGIDQTAQRHGYHVLVSSSHNHESEVEAALRTMRGRVDGLIVMWPDMDARAAVTSLPPPEILPVVLLNCAIDGSAFDSITIENFEGAYAMVRHLIACGHRRIAMITGPERNHDAAERLRGYRAALRDAGIGEAHACEVPGDFRERSGYRAAAELVRRDPRPTAIFAGNDSMAIGALSALREGGVRVPEDMAVAGFDDIPMARYMDPPLSSVHVDISALGEHATSRLLAALEGDRRQERRRETLPTTLMIRRSCGGKEPGRLPTGPVAQEHNVPFLTL